MPRSTFLATVHRNQPLCREHFRLLLHIVSGFPETKPGQFIQIACRDVELMDDPEPHNDFAWDPDNEQPTRVMGAELGAPVALLRRPFSLAGRRELVVDRASAVTELEIIHRVVGVGTEWMSHLHEGDLVNILGPLGNHFTLPPDGSAAILVGGGVGIPPMLYLADDMKRSNCIVFSGAVSRDLLPLKIDQAFDGDDPCVPRPRVREFARNNIDSVVSTDDGSYGFRGFVTQALEQYLDSRADPSTRPILYTCGPEPMMQRVAEIGATRGLEVQVAVERAMACGMGTCQSCCIRIRKSESDWRYALACTEGPIFRGEQLLW
jgi:dihydroorotate dehydrogenase electron transfer subunit